MFYAQNLKESSSRLEVEEDRPTLQKASGHLHHACSHVAHGLGHLLALWLPGHPLIPQTELPTAQQPRSEARGATRVGLGTLLELSTAWVLLEGRWVGT